LDDDALSMNEQRHSSDDNVLTDAHIIDFARLKILRRLGERTSRMELLAAFLDGEPVLSNYVETKRDKNIFIFIFPKK